MRDTGRIDSECTLPFTGVSLRSFFARTAKLPFLEEIHERNIFSSGIQLPCHRGKIVSPDNPNRVRQNFLGVFSQYSSNKGKSGSIFPRKLLEYHGGE